MKLAKARRISQIVFLALFLCLLFQTEFRGSFHTVHGDPRLPYPVRWFLELDPLIALGSALASHALYQGLLWSLAILIPTLFLGRFFCGWICPLGTLHHWISGFRSKSKLGLRRIESNRYQRWQELKYYLLAALLVAALLGSGIYGLLDPISLLVRSLAISVLPAMNYAVNATVDVLSRSGWRGLWYLGAALHFFLKDTLLNFSQPYFRQGLLIGLIFAVILILNLRYHAVLVPRAVPAGALLGLVSRWSILGLEKRPANATTATAACSIARAATIPFPASRWRKAECHLCMNCVADCPDSGLRFPLFPGDRRPVRAPDLERRKVLTGLAAGAALLPLLRANTGLAVRTDRAPDPAAGGAGRVQFPGALHPLRRVHEGLPEQRPASGVHRSRAGGPLDAGAGAAHRLLRAELHAVRPGLPHRRDLGVHVREKGWVAEPADPSAQPIRLGTAFYDRGRCLPWAMATECIVCEEWCPTSPKAIYLRPAEVADAATETSAGPAALHRSRALRRLRRLRVCVPGAGRPAVYVTSVGESRSKTNQILLQRAAEKPASLLPRAASARDVAQSRRNARL